MNQEERIEQLERALEEERAYSSMLEISIQMEVEKQSGEAIKEARQRGYEDGLQRRQAPQINQIASNFTKELEFTLNKEIPGLLASAIPEKYLGVVRGDMFRPQVSTQIKHNPHSMCYNTSATITIPATIINLGYSLAEESIA